MRIAKELPPSGLQGSQFRAHQIESRPEEDFLQTIQQYLGDVNHMQHRADGAAEQLAIGEIEFHDAMLTTEKANLALQLTMSVRNKIMDAYQEIMRMQV